MKTILVSVEDEEDPRRALEAVVALGQREPICVHLLSVRAPLPQYVGRFFTADAIGRLHREDGERALAPARRALEQAGVAHFVHVRVGYKAETIVRAAADLACERIVLAGQGNALLARMRLGSIAAQVRHLLASTHRACEVG